jgi:amidase
MIYRFDPHTMPGPGLLAMCAAGAALGALLGVSEASAQRVASRVSGDIVFEKTIPELQAAMASGRVTSVDLVQAYLARIEAYDQQGPRLNSIMGRNPRAAAEAAALDAERRAGRVRGPLHGVPVILKDNFGTRDMPTSASSIALAGLETRADAFQVRKLRDAGAVILAKSSMHELASGITNISSLGGQACNPYDPDRIPGGSSGGSGAAVAASFAAIAFGSDTCGSIRIPAAVHNLFGLRPTKGLSSVSGVIPLSHTQDVAGPLARTVVDLAIGLDATIGPDPADTATRILEGRPPPGFVAALDSTALRRARIGVLTPYFGTEADDQEATRVARAALDKMKARGAQLVEVAIPGLDSLLTAAGVIDYEFKYDLIDFLANIPDAPVRSLSDILQRGLYHVRLEQSFRRRDSLGTRDGERYRAALARRKVVRDLVVALLDSNRLDAVAYPTMRRKPAIIGELTGRTHCQLSAVTGLPALSMPAGFTPDSLPIGVELLGRPLADARLVAFAYDYEQATRPRRAPSTTPPLVEGRAPKPVAFTTTAIANGVTVRGEFAFDPTRRSLEYAVRVTGARAGQVYAVSIDRDSAGRKGPMLRHLVGPGATRSQGTLKLAAPERADLLAGRLALVLYTETDRGVAAKARMLVPVDQARPAH